MKHKRTNIAAKNTRGKLQHKNHYLCEIINDAYIREKEGKYYYIFKRQWKIIITVISLLIKFIK